MTEIYFRQAASIVVEDPTDAEAIKPLKEGLPRSAQRRMTLMGLMMHRLLEDRGISDEFSIVYHTAFGESRTMKDYIDTYPYPSPMAFQASIHPSAVEQSLILRRQSVRYFMPMAGRDALFQSLRIALDLPAGSIVCGAEEWEPWLAKYNLSSRPSHAWAVSLCAPTEAEGRFVVEASASDAPAEGNVSELPRAMAAKQPWGCHRPGLGTLQLQWL